MGGRLILRGLSCLGDMRAIQPCRRTRLFFKSDLVECTIEMTGAKLGNWHGPVLQPQSRWGAEKGNISLRYRRFAD